MDICYAGMIFLSARSVLPLHFLAPVRFVLKYDPETQTRYGATV